MIRKLLRGISGGLQAVRRGVAPGGPTPRRHAADVPAPHSRPAAQRHAAGAGRESEPAHPPAGHWDVSGFHVPPEEGKTRFHDLGLPVALMHAVSDLGFRYCTPIQAAIMPALIAGRDAAGQAQTGTGKTAAFLISIFTHILAHPPPGGRPPGSVLSLVLAPTRELALQIEKEAAAIGRHTGLTTAAVYGGMDYEKQRQRLKSGPVDLLVATPGRLLDFLGKKTVDLSRVTTLVVDEADRMLDMGFIPDVRRIVRATPPKSQRRTWLFSATLSPEVMRLASQWMNDAVKVEIAPERPAAENVRQMVYIVTARDKFALLHHLLQREPAERVLVFTNRRDQTARLADRLRRCGVDCAVLSGDVPQDKRMKRLEDFRSGKLRVVVATDVAGRGLHVDDISHVINYNLPLDPESYIHRIGRTGRAGDTGVSISFACEEDAFDLPVIEKLIGQPLNYVHPEDSWLRPPPELPAPRAAAGEGNGAQGGGRRGDRRRGPRGHGHSHRHPAGRHGAA